MEQKQLVMEKFGPTSPRLIRVGRDLPQPSISVPPYFCHSAALPDAQPVFLSTISAV